MKNVLLYPGIENLQSGPDSVWMEQLIANLDLVLMKYSGESIIALTPDSNKTKETFSEPVFLIFLMHVSYASSEKYLDFLERISVEGKDTINHIVRIDTSAELGTKIPERFGAAAGIKLFSATAESGIASWIEEKAATYWSRLLDLASELKTMKDSENLVFVAQASADMRVNRNIIRRELTEHGFRVVPESDLAVRDTDLKSYIQGLTEKSKLAIHLLGNEYGPTMKTSGFSISETQVQFITEYLEAIENDPVNASKDINRLIWIDPDYNPVDSQQEEFINRLKRNIENLHRTEIIQTPLELFKTLVINRLRQLNKNASQNSGDNIKGEKFVYVIHSMDDQKGAEALTLGLKESGLATGLLDYSRMQRNLLEDHKKNLRECESAIVYYGKPNRPWLQSKVMDLLKAPGMGRSHSLVSRQILAADKDLLEDFFLPHGISLTREPDLSESVKQLMKNLK